MFNVLVAGALTDDARLGKYIDELFGQIKAYLFENSNGVSTRVFVSDEYTDSGWNEKICLSDNHICAVSDVDTNKWNGDSVLKIKTDVRRVVGEMLCNKADLIIAVWNETVAEMNGATWELIQIARSKNTPLIWISSDNYEIHWCESAFYEIYTPEKLKNICELHSEPELVLENSQQKHIPLLWIGNIFYKTFLKCFSRKPSDEKVAEDVIMSPDFCEMAQDSSGESQRKKLLDAFNKYDSIALKYNRKFRMVAYWRAILPIFATLFIAVGFYAGTLAPYICGGKNGWKIVAGVGFLIHGLVNLYVYYLSESKTVKKWQDTFVNSRFVAEILRVIIHFEPYGISINLRKLAGSNDTVFRTVKNVTDNNGSYAINEESSKKILCHLNEMLDNQIQYHKASEKKYSRIVSVLEKSEKAFVHIGALLVVLRALFQFVVVVNPEFISGPERFGIETPDFWKSFANMLALVVPAIASYFASKLALCNFKFDYENHKNTQIRLDALKKRVENLITLDSPIKMEILSSLGDDVAKTVLAEDTYIWHSQYMSTTIKRL